MTQAFDRNGALDLVAIDGKELSHGKGSNRSRLRSLLSRQQKYAVSGYSNRLRTFQDFRRLVVDALTGSAALRPCGTEVRPNVWLGDGAVIDESARVAGPAFIGCNTRIGAGCVITGNSSIERNCETDCGTTVHQSCILPGTYLGLGIKVKNCVVAGQSLFHLGRNLQLHVEDSRIIGDGEKSGRLMEAARTFMRKGSVRREQSCQPTRPDLHL